MATGTGAQPLPRERPVQFGKYTLLSRIATGGMGELFLAQLRAAGGFEKLVVIKRILPHLTDQREFVDMFVEEARTAARITHPNVCQIYELGQVDGRYYMALEYLEGIPLADVMVARKRAPQLADLRLISALVAQAAEGLHHAHSLRSADGENAGVVHRDVNPRNVFVTSAGVAKVLDFGIVKVRGALSQTRTGSVKGTYSYMAPEQLQGENLDCTADIFALGTITWEAVVGRRLFKRASDLLTWRAIVDEPVPRPSQFRYDLPADLDDAIMRALGKRREERYPSAREFALALERAIKPLGAPFTTLAISSELEKAFATELNDQRSRVFSAHKDQEAERLGGSPMGAEDWGDPSLGSQATRVADDNYENLVATTSAVRQPAMAARASAQRRGQSEPPLHTPSEIQTIDEPAMNVGRMSPSRASAQRRVPLRAPEEHQATPRPRGPGGPLVSTASFVDEVAPGEDFEPPLWPPTGQSKVIAPRESSSTSHPQRSRRSHDLRSRSPWPMVLALVVFGVGAAAFAYVLKKDGVSRADDAKAAAGVAPAATPAASSAPMPAATPVPEEEKKPEPKTERDTSAAPDGPVVATPVPPVKQEPKPEPKKPEPKPEARKQEPKKPEPKKPEPKKPEPKKPEPKKPEPKKPVPKSSGEVKTAEAVKGGGFLTINAEPYATVYIDGKKRGYTPIVRLSLPAGSHSIRLVSSAGQPDKKMTVKVGAGEDVRKFVKW